MKAPTASILLLCMPLQSAGVGSSLLTAWTTPPLSHAKRGPSATFCSKSASVAASTSWTAATRARERGVVAVSPLCSKSRGSAGPPLAVSALSSTAPAATQPSGKQSLFIFGIGYVATAIALTYLRKGWAVHGTCTDPRKVKSLGDQGIKVGSTLLLSVDSAEQWP